MQGLKSWLNCGFVGMYGSEAGVVVVELCLKSRVVKQGVAQVCYG